ncbi:MAG: nucleoside hydrolase [Brevinema sp.]
MVPLIWFDTDPGIDDAIALLWLLNNPSKIRVGGISTVVGNFPIDDVTRNALALVEYMNSSLPVHQGAGVRLTGIPFQRDERLCLAAHGADGMALINASSTKSPASQIMPDALAEAILQSSEDWILMPVGPLTNIAMFIQKYPQLLSRIKRIYMMGGASSKIEFNILCDCEAANIVFQSGIPITMMPLDITTKIRVSQQKLTEFQQTHKLLSWAKKLLEFGTLPDSDCMHDPCTIIALLYPELFKGRTIYAEAITKGERTGALVLHDKPQVSKHSEVLFLDSCTYADVIDVILGGLEN